MAHSRLIVRYPGVNLPFQEWILSRELRLFKRGIEQFPNPLSDGHGISISWCKGLLELEIEVLADATLEVVTTWAAAELIEQACFEKEASWRLQRLFSWLGNAPLYAH